MSYATITIHSQTRKSIMADKHVIAWHGLDNSIFFSGYRISL